MSRRGVEISSFTLHPAGIPHGPHPGTAEASIGKEPTEELAVMVDTFHPLRLTKQAAALDDDRYPYSWLPPEDGGAELTSSPAAAPRRSPTSAEDDSACGAGWPAAGAAGSWAPRPLGPAPGGNAASGGGRSTSGQRAAFREIPTELNDVGIRCR